MNEGRLHLARMTPISLRGPNPNKRGGFGANMILIVLLWCQIALVLNNWGGLITEGLGSWAATMADLQVSFLYTTMPLPSSWMYFEINTSELPNFVRFQGSRFHWCDGMAATVWTHWQRGDCEDGCLASVVWSNNFPALEPHSFVNLQNLDLTINVVGVDKQWVCCRTCSQERQHLI